MDVLCVVARDRDVDVDRREASDADVTALTHTATTMAYVVYANH